MDKTKVYPLYKGQEAVRAFKIKSVFPTSYCWATIIPEDEKLAEKEVNSEFVNTHRPEAGGYFVVYKDGYETYSTARVFEGGYAKAKEEVVAEVVVAPAENSEV